MPWVLWMPGCGRNSEISNSSFPHNEHTKKLLEIRNQFREVAGYKISRQKSAVFL